MRPVHFDVHGWRARRGEGFDGESLSAVAAALGLAWGMAHEGATVLVGYDTRFDSRGGARLVAGVIASYGLVVRVSASPCPLPALGWNVARDPGCVGGVMVTADDAPREYNGVIVCGEDGGSPSESFARAVDRLIAPSPQEAADGIGQTDTLGSYLGHLMSAVKSEAIVAARPRVVVDPMYGTAGGCVAALLRNLGCEVREIRGDGQGDLGDVEPRPCEPMVEMNCSAVRENKFDLGLSFGGACRRLALVDERGVKVSPHDVAPLVLRDLVERRGLSGRVVGTLACSARLASEAEDLGLDYVSVPVGFGRLHFEMADGDVLLAADEYGGVSVAPHLKGRDAIVTALCLLEGFAGSGAPVSRAVDELEERCGGWSYGRKDLHLEPEKIQTFRNLLPGLNPAGLGGKTSEEVSHADGLKVVLQGGSWVMMRPSRTQTLVRIYAEGRSQDEMKELLRCAEEIVGAGLSAAR